MTYIATEHSFVFHHEMSEMIVFLNVLVFVTLSETIGDCVHWAVMDCFCVALPWLGGSSIPPLSILSFWSQKEPYLDNREELEEK